MSTSADFWDKVSAKYALKAVPSEEIYKEKLKRTQKLFSPSSVAMEFGCGTGTTALIHAHHLAKIKAYDFSPKMIQIANQKKQDQNIVNVKFEVKAIEEIPFPREKYDIVMGHSILHLTKNNKEILSKVYASLKPGGFFVSSSGCVKEMNFLIRQVLPFITAIGKAPYINSFSSDELIELHKEVGFKIYDAWKYKAGELFLIAKK